MTEILAEAPYTVADGPQRHARYADLAAAAPVHRIKLPIGKLVWLITGYREVRQALHDPRLVKCDVALADIGRGLLPPEVFAAMNSHMLNRNQPDHTRLRRLVIPAFTRRRFEQLAPRHPADHQRAPRRYGRCGATRPDRVICALAAPHRDLPDALDITRTDNAHLAFGHGIHHCLGALLVRLEGRIALGTLLVRFPRLRLAVPAKQLVWRPGVLMNGLAALPVLLR
jgi:cytochrome P450